LRKVFIITIAFTALLGVSVAAWAASDSPGTEGDPIVSKSYVDAKTSFSPIQLTQGQKLIGAEGAEIILRSGEASAIDNGLNGISDLTFGTDLMTGNQVVLNHLLLVPRSDGRGISAITDIWIMVRGSYTIQ